MRIAAAFSRVYKFDPAISHFRIETYTNRRITEKARLRRRRSPQGETQNLGRTFAARGFGQQHGQYLGIEFMRRPDFGQVGEEIEIVDDTEFDDLLDSAVIGDEVAAESREVSVVLQVDVHLLARIGREQDSQQKCRITLFEELLHLLHSGEDTKKKDRDKRSLQKYLLMRMYVLSGNPRGKRTPPANRAAQMLMSRISKWIVPAGTSTSTRSPFLRPSSAFAIGVPIASLPSRRFASCSATIV